MSKVWKKGDLKIHFLQYYSVVELWAWKGHGFKSAADVRRLLYLAPIPLFTRQDFKDGKFRLTWDKKKFDWFRHEGWIIKVHNGNRRAGEHDKYAISSKGQRLVNRIYRMCVGEEDIPESKKRNPVMKEGNMYSELIKKFNRRND